MRIAVVSRGLGATTRFLQPWRYLTEIAVGLAARGHEVEFVTDAASPPALPSGVSVSTTTGRPWPITVRKRLDRARPDVVLWNVGATSALPARSPVPRSGRNVAIFTSPLVRVADLWRVRNDVVRHPGQYVALVGGALVPRSVLVSYLSHTFERIVTLGPTTAQALIVGGVPRERVLVVPPGRDSEPPASTAAEPETPGRVRFIFAGSPATIRGADLLIRAFAGNRQALDGAELLILSREEHATLSTGTARLRRLAERLGVADRVEFVAGTLPRSRFLEELDRGLAVVLPFRLVPSEAPLLVIEAAQRGKLLIASDLPPIRDLAAPGSILVRPDDVGALGRALVRVATHRAEGLAAGHYAQEAARTRPTWDDVAARMESIVAGPDQWVRGRLSTSGGVAR